MRSVLNAVLQNKRASLLTVGMVGSRARLPVYLTPATCRVLFINKFLGLRMRRGLFLTFQFVSAVNAWIRLNVCWAAVVNGSDNDYNKNIVKISPKYWMIRSLMRSSVISSSVIRLFMLRVIRLQSPCIHDQTHWSEANLLNNTKYGFGARAHRRGWVP